MPVIRFPFALAMAATMLVAIGWLDYVTSYEVSVAILYYFPIAFAAWYLGWSWSFCFGLLCTATLTWAEQASGLQYSRAWMMWEVAGVRSLGFAFIAFSFNFFKKTLDREREKFRRLEAMFIFCNCCGRVRDERDNWTDMQVLLREDPVYRSRLRICPECSRAAYARGHEGRLADGS
jgi:hypothetical protein